MFKSYSFIVSLPSALDLASLSACSVARSTHGVAGLLSLPTDGRRYWSLISHYAGHLGKPVCCYIQNRCGGNITCNHPDCWFEKAGTWSFFPDELWRPDHQGGLHVLDPRGREETSSSLESDAWALVEDFKHVPVGAPTSLKGCLSLLMLTEKFYNLDSFWGEEL